MEKEVIYYIYGFNADILNGNKSFYFENKEDAEYARFMVYKMFDKQRLTINGFVPPVTGVRKKSLREHELKKYRILSNYDDFIEAWMELSDKEHNKGLSN